MNAAEYMAFVLHAVSNDSAPACIAAWRERLDGALERIKVVRFSLECNLKGFVIFVAASFAFRHIVTSPIYLFADTI
jgi:hypothetical protein